MYVQVLLSISLSMTKGLNVMSMYVQVLTGQQSDGIYATLFIFSVNTLQKVFLFLGSTWTTSNYYFILKKNSKLWWFKYSKSYIDSLTKCKEFFFYSYLKWTPCSICI